MKLIRFGEPGAEQPGVLTGDGVIALREAFADIPDIGPAFFGGGWLSRIRSVDSPARAYDGRLGAPVSHPAKIICLGKNYAEHAKEGGFDNPASPLIFCKTPNTINGPFDDIVLPVSSGDVDWEVELALVIGRGGKRIRRDDALDHVAGYMVMNDVSGREAQFADSQWFRGKAFDTFAPMGPALVTTDEIPDIDRVRLVAEVNGEVMQDGNTRDMIFDIPTIIENISEDITLAPGDVISTGTPSGVGIFRDPPVTLKPGDVVECRIEGVGTIRNTVVSATG
jgi:2-keto-4-pentenoate hydratase/2-oxohepta-3-ene-1,7-dioic acid hydratase in catechol pathway